MRLSNTVPALFVLVSATACGAAAPEASGSLDRDARPLQQAMDRVTRVMVDEVTSPPVAARTYAYASIAAYEAARHVRPGGRTLAGQLPGLKAVPEPGPDVVGPVAAVAALLTVAESLVYDEAAVAAYRDSLLDAFGDRGVPRRGVRASAAYGGEVASHVLAWAATDGLKEARALPRYRVEQDDPSRWQPTPPAYMAGIEPNWDVLRPFVLRTAAEFRPPPPVPYDTTPGSPFQREVRAVYDAVTEATQEEIEIAKFWDCNPYALQAEGHFMFSMKKITPGGHWMGITGVALEESGAGVVEAAEAYALVAIALADGFLSVWEEKYRSELVRPETVINRGMDPGWRPILQTPPFPEYTSGHSVVSGAAAEVLTVLFGEDFAYHDDVEVPYGLPVRSYASFREAAEEAAISRLYGGIHYPMAVEHGLTQGRAVGKAVIQRVRTGARVADATR
ncbi:MAG: vanadium-dependent haloperoxidase [Longimicrobiales bacterium]|nr:vanadium-dependent haloperoxidase [Longimicrobiales bacterium]